MTKILMVVACCIVVGCDVQRSGLDALDKAMRKHEAGAHLTYINPKDPGDIRVTGYGYLVDGRVWRSTGKPETNTYEGFRHVVRDQIAKEMAGGTR